MARFHSLIFALVGAAFVAFAGWVCLVMPFAAGLKRLSYDLPFAIRSNLATPEICLVTIDEKAARMLRQPMDHTWDRRLHAQLVRSLTEAGARAVVFDVVFAEENPAVDEEFAAAIRANGHVFLGADLNVSPGREAVVEQLFPPTAVLRRAATGWGLIAFRPIDPDYGVRRIYPGTEEALSIPWKVANALGVPLPGEQGSPGNTRWLNYYGPAGMFQSVSYDQALRPAELPPGIFRDRIVLVGGRYSLGHLAEQKDEFRNPYTRWGQPFSPGVEIHATALLNLLRGEWLTRMPARTEHWLMLLFGAGATFLLSAICAFCPFRATAAAAAIMILTGAAACWGVWQHQVWWDWLVPALIQTPAALFWSLSANYLLQVRQRTIIRRAFSLYLSPHMANEIANARFDLKPGGEIVEATMMFTDLEGFTQLSEKLRDPRQISEVLITYFNNTTRHILDNRGTIIKYVGDAVYATWGAPLADKDHAYHAVLAAWGMHQFSQLDVHGHRLVTRIGVNTGSALAGNLGSDFRFDYTLIGDAVNLASRLEGLNKYLGTRVLLSEETWNKVSTRFAGRLVGRFRVKGREDPVAIYELLGPKITDFVQAAMDVFAEGIAAFRAGDLVKARERMEKTCELRGGGDGPAEYYLVEITHLEKEGLPADWDGVLEASGK